MSKNKKDQKKFRLNTSETMKYLERTKENSKKTKMRSSITNSKDRRNVKSLYQIIVLPDKPAYYVEDMEDPDELIDVKDWWAENTVDFLNEVQLMFGTLTTGNKGWLEVRRKAVKDVAVGYPRDVQYMWKLDADTPPKVLPVHDYIHHVLMWCNAQVENEEIFPTDEDNPFPRNFLNYLQKMFKRMFRIFHIIYSNPCLHQNKDQEKPLELCFKHFLYFGWKWSLLDTKETDSMKTVTKKLRQRFLKEQKSYLNHTLKLE